MIDTIALIIGYGVLTVSAILLWFVAMFYLLELLQRLWSEIKG